MGWAVAFAMKTIQKQRINQLSFQNVLITFIQLVSRNGWRKKGPAAQDRQSAETAESVQTADLDFDVFPSKATHSARSVVRLVTCIIRPCLNR